MKVVCCQNVKAFQVSYRVKPLNSCFFKLSPTVFFIYCSLRLNTERVPLSDEGGTGLHFRMVATKHIIPINEMIIVRAVKESFILYIWTFFRF